MDSSSNLRQDLAHVVMAKRRRDIAIPADALRTLMGTPMRVELRLPNVLWRQLHSDLSRPHPHAAERVAFLSCRPASMRSSGCLLLGVDHHPVLDEDYERDNSVGAMLGPGAFRRILQLAYNYPVSIFHVHRHEHKGNPWFSHVDVREAKRYVPDFWKVRSGFPHGILLLSHDSAAGLVWLPELSVQVRMQRISVVGAPIREIHANE